MGDLKTTSYQADYLKKFATDREQEPNIYYNLPDQFVEYESKSYNPFYFFTSSGEFNLNEINKSYRLEQIKRMQFYKGLEETRQAEINKINPPKPSLTELSLYQHIMNFQNTFFGIISDLESAQTPINSDILTKNNRLFFIGILIMFIAIVILLVHSVASIKFQNGAKPV